MRLAAARDAVVHGLRAALAARLRLSPPTPPRTWRRFERALARLSSRCDMTSLPCPRRAPSSSAAASSAARSPITWRSSAGATSSLLERGKLTSRLDLPRRRPGRAAAHLGQHHAAADRTASSSTSALEAETGQATGWKQNGGLRLACNAERLTEIKRQATTAHSFGLEMHLLTPQEAHDLWPLMDGRRPGRRRLPADRRPGQPVRHRAGAGEGRARAAASRSSRT